MVEVAVAIAIVAAPIAVLVVVAVSMVIVICRKTKVSNTGLSSHYLQCAHDPTAVAGHANCRQHKVLVVPRSKCTIMPKHLHSGHRATGGSAALMQ